MRVCCLTVKCPAQGFYPVGAHCSIAGGNVKRQEDFNGRIIPFNPRQEVIVKPLMSSGGRHISCECYVRRVWDSELITEDSQLSLGEVQCRLTVTLCPLSLSSLNITTVL